MEARVGWAGAAAAMEARYGREGEGESGLRGDSEDSAPARSFLALHVCRPWLLFFLLPHTHSHCAHMTTRLTLVSSSARAKEKTVPEREKEREREREGEQ